MGESANISKSQLLIQQNKIRKEIKNDVVKSFKSNDIKNKASLYNMAMPQYIRLYILAKVLKVENYESMDVNQLTIAIQNTISITGQLTAVIVFTIIDEIQYMLLKNLIKHAPLSLAKQVISLLKKLGAMLKMDISDEMILEAMYVADVTQIRNNTKYDKYQFNKLSQAEKLQHVNNVIAHGVAMSYAYEASSIIAQKLKFEKLLNVIRNLVLITKYVSYLNKTKESEIHGGKFTSILSENIKVIIIRILSIIPIPKLRYLFRFVLEVILGPLMLVSLSSNYDTARSAALNNKF